MPLLRYNPRFGYPNALTLDRALERVFAQGTAVLMQYVRGEIHYTRTSEAFAPPFINRYVYTRHILWLAYAGALVTVMIPGLIGCYYVWKGFTLTDETTLAKILVTTRGESLNIVKGMSVDRVDSLVLRYGRDRPSTEWEDGMGFSVVLGEEAQESVEENAHLLAKM